MGGLHPLHPDHRALRLLRFTEFVATERGLAAALRSGAPAVAALPASSEGDLGPALRGLLDAAAADGSIVDDVGPIELLGAIANLSTPLPGIEDPSRAVRMVALLLAGSRYRSPSPAPGPRRKSS